jgi:hypothetical protein
MKMSEKNLKFIADRLAHLWIKKYRLVFATLYLEGLHMILSYAN